jgi:hypothetical protein
MEELPPGTAAVLAAADAPTLAAAGAPTRRQKKSPSFPNLPDPRPLLQESEAAEALLPSALHNGNLQRQKRSRHPLSGHVSRLWLALAAGVVAIMLVSTCVYMAYERWSFLRALFFAVSIGYSVGMVPMDVNGTAVMVSSDGAMVYMCIHALLGGLCLAAAAALAGQQVLMRDEQYVRREYERATKARHHHESDPQVVPL